MKGKAKLAHVVGMAGKIVGAKQDSLSDLYLTAVEQKTARILNVMFTEERDVMFT